MKKVINYVLLAASMTAGIAASANANDLNELLKQVKADRLSEAKIDKKREAEFMSAKADKQALLNQAQADLKAEKDRGDRLKNQYAQNENTLAMKAQELKNAEGTLGEMFGVIRRAASNTIGSITTSNICAQYPGRSELLTKLAAAKELPTTKEMEELWIALQTEMTESAKVVKFEAQVSQLGGGSIVEQVTRVGSFNLITDAGSYVIYNS